ncbi:MAG: thiamin biosynthesis lipoprotein ApbE [Nitrospirales bacterium]|nr:MAG: thiamin biosynthesis lipoprotein ApbE [Nitrospirales bacterium]
MGTTYQVTIVHPSSQTSLSTIQAKTEQILARINSSMSTYQVDSELSQFNRNQTTQWVSVSPDLHRVVKEALRVGTLSDGAFDVSVGPIVDLWGFGPTPRHNTIPSEETIHSRLQIIGYDHLHVQDDPPAIRKEIPALSVDLSAIAKGYAVDQVAEYLASLDLTNYLVEIGGELRAHGRNAHGVPWNVAIEQPMSTKRTIHRLVRLDNHSVATSGDYRNFFERDGTRFSHTINPTTGKPVTHNLSSVTVIAESSMNADALATALLVLGPEEGFELAEQEQVASLFLIMDDEGFREKATTTFTQYSES